MWLHKETLEVCIWFEQTHVVCFFSYWMYQVAFLHKAVSLWVLPVIPENHRPGRSWRGPQHSYCNDEHLLSAKYFQQLRIFQWAKKSSCSRELTFYLEQLEWRQEVREESGTWKNKQATGQENMLDGSRGAMPNKKARKGFPGVQWHRICLPIQGTQVRSLVQEDPTHHKNQAGATTEAYTPCRVCVL